MRIFCASLFFLFPLLFAETALPQNVWHNSPYQDITYSGFHFDSFGVEAGKAVLKRNDLTRPNDPKTINNFYAAGGTLSNEGHSLTIERFWVNTDTLQRMSKNILNYGNPFAKYSINELTLQVGKKTINNGKSFGTNVDVPTLTLSDDFISLGTSPIKGNGQYGTPTSFSVANSGTVTDAELLGGTFYNLGSVNNLTYGGGNFVDQGGIIKTLNLTSDSHGQSWGVVEHLYFASHGSGLINLTLTGVVENDKLVFEGVQVSESVDFTNGNIVLDMSHVIEEMTRSSRSAMQTAPLESEDWAALLYERFGSEAFSFTNLFSAELVTGSLNMEMQWGGNSDQRVAIVNAGEWQSGWEPTKATTPEPATLMLLGWGLAGLGLATRRRK